MEWLVGIQAAAIVVLMYVFSRWRPKSPPPEPERVEKVADLTTVLTTMIETNARITQDMVTRGLESITIALERATYGPPAPPEPPVLASDGGPDKWDAPPWADWPADGDVTEPSDASIPEWSDISGPRAVSVRKLPDLTGEDL